MRDDIECSKSDAMVTLDIGQPDGDGRCLVVYSIKGRFHSPTNVRKSVTVESADQLALAIPAILMVAR